jgi:hypothetical protein
MEHRFKVGDYVLVNPNLHTYDCECVNPDDIDFKLYGEICIVREMLDCKGKLFKIKSVSHSGDLITLHESEFTWTDTMLCPNNYCKLRLDRILKKQGMDDEW